MSVFWAIVVTAVVVAILALGADVLFVEPFRHHPQH
jgi:hypothetical protein